MQTYQNQPAGAGMASFVARLMSLNQQELQCLHSDSELMRQLTETQLLMETRLQHIQLQNKLQLHFHQHYQQAPAAQSQLSQVAYLDHYYHQLAAQHEQQQHQQQHQQQQHQHQAAAHQLALDLRTQQQHHWPPVSCPAGSSPNSPNPQQGEQQQLNPKKLKLSEYQRSQQQESSTSGRERPEKRARAVPAANVPSTVSEAASALQAAQLSQITQIVASQPKKYKGEFDEPAPGDVEQRLAALSCQESYHKLQRCACVLGSEFHDKSVESVLQMIDLWRQLPTEQRVKTKWDLADLPKDIPLSEIKKFEQLRREASNGRADFGGASKRKPLGIRGTRQFLLILYCLWGHPGRDDPMQKEGYCPHCFAKIKKPNEQSTLVRVVNHFNMKHRRGANPRLSPHRELAAASQQALTSGAPSPAQVAPGGPEPLAGRLNSPGPVSSTTRELPAEARAEQENSCAEAGNSCCKSSLEPHPVKLEQRPAQAIT